MASRDYLPKLSRANVEDLRRLYVKLDRVGGQLSHTNVAARDIICAELADVQAWIGGLINTCDAAMLRWRINNNRLTQEDREAMAAQSEASIEVRPTLEEG